MWQYIQKLVNAGLTADAAIGKIRIFYDLDTGPATMEQIILGLIADKIRYKEQGGLHPNLYELEKSNDTVL